MDDPPPGETPPASLLSSLFNNGAAARGQAAPGLPRAPVSLHVHEAATRAGRGGAQSRGVPVRALRAEITPPQDLPSLLRKKRLAAVSGLVVVMEAVRF